MKKIFCLFSFFMLVTFYLPAYEFVDFMGETPEEIFVKIGSPTELFTMRGETAEDDDVVFYYPQDSLYLFFYKNKVWQFRLDDRFKGEVSGIKIGDSRENVDAVLGIPYNRSSDSDVFINPGKFGKKISYKFKVRIYYDKKNCVSDIYVYRSNF